MIPSFTDDELEHLADLAYKRRTMSCPRCEAPVRSREMEIAGRRTDPLMLSCQRCGAHGQYSPDHLEAMELEWSRDEKIQIIERYWNQGSARCARDDSVLKTIKSQTIAPPPANVSFRCPRCGRNFQSRDIETEIDPSSFEGHYSEVEKIDRGGMGEVVLARHQVTGEFWAAKRIRPDFLRSPDSVRRFQREARILAALAHKNVLPIKETFLDDKGGVIVMPFVDGGTLTARINDENVGSLDLLSYFRDIVRGISYLHAEGVVHRDLKPDNVLIDEASGGVARISDFGLARLIDRDSTTLTVGLGLLGTPRYAAPEQEVDAANVDWKSDIYSLALIAYEIATRKSPFRTIDLTGLQAPLRKEIAQCLEDEPIDRPSSGEDLLAALKAHLEGT